MTRRRQPLAHHYRDRYLLEDWTDTMTTQTQLPLPARACAPDRLAIVGAGRMGMALARALSAAAIEFEGPLARGGSPSAAADAVLLCVPDAQIEAAASAVEPRAGMLVGHCSAATTAKADDEGRQLGLF